jgi:hypothetical protein
MEKAVDTVQAATATRKAFQVFDVQRTANPRVTDPIQHNVTRFLEVSKSMTQ